MEPSIIRKSLSRLILFIFSSSALAESCEVFYTKFKLSQTFRIEHTKFPLKVVTFIGQDQESKEHHKFVSKLDVSEEKTKIFPDYGIIEKHKYVQILKNISPFTRYALSCDTRKGRH